MTSPSRVQRTSVPAKYQTIHKQVVSDPGGVEEIPVPAEYRNITVEDIIHPGGENMVNVPPKFANVTTKTLTSPERYEWRRVLCAPGTGSIKSSADYASHTTSQSSAVYAQPITSSYTYTQPSYTAPLPQTSGRIVTGTGYYGGYNSKAPESDYSVQDGINGHARRKNRRYRK